MLIAVVVFVCSTNGKSLPLLHSRSNEEKLLEADALLIEAASEKNKGNFDKAIQLYYTCLRLPGEKSVIHYEIAQLQYNEYKSYDQAIKHISKALEIDHTNYWYLLFYIKINKENRYPLLVEKGYRQLMVNNAQNYEVILDFAEFYILEKQYTKALQLYESLEKEIGVTEDVNKNIFLIYKGMGKTEQAIIEINKLIDKFPRNPEYYLELINIYRSLQQKENIQLSYKKANKALPENSFILDDYAHYLFNTNRIDSAFIFHQKVISDQSYEFRPKKEIIDQYIKNEKIDSTLKSKISKLLQLLETAHSENFDVYRYLGEVYYFSKEYQNAKINFNKALTINKNSFEIWQQLILIDFQAKDFLGMKKTATEAMEIFPAQAELFYYSAMSSIEQNKHQEAIDVLQLGVTLTNVKSLKIQFYSSLGDSYHTLLNNLESDKYYEKALELDSNNTFVLNNYAYYLSERTLSLDKAEKLSKRSIQLSPTTYSFLDTYGWILFSMGKNEKALEWLLQSESYGGDKSAVVLEHIADVYLILGQKEQAISYWKRALKLGGNSEILNTKINTK